MVGKTQVRCQARHTVQPCQFSPNDLTTLAGIEKEAHAPSPTD